jgi:hemoglobin-like flavoprotein
MSKAALTSGEIRLVQDSFVKVAPIAEQAAQLFYDRLFELDPKLTALFKGDMKQQGRTLMSMIAAAVKGLNNLEKLVPVVHALGRRHKGHNVKPGDYDTVARALLWTLEQGLNLGPVRHRVPDRPGHGGPADADPGGHREADERARHGADERMRRGGVTITGRWRES